tara:strand:+ start:3993 stop:4523 length:531 start_codon:yes stop_codon:yes gene_type:complete
MCGLILFFGGIYIPVVSAADLLVEASVEPFVSVRAISNFARIGPVGAGGVDAELPFYIESNSNRVSVQLLVSHLYKDENPLLGVYLPVDVSTGVEVRTQTARPVGGDLSLRFIGTDNLSKRLGVFAAMKSEALILEVPDKALFNEEVGFQINWLRAQRLMPSGNYRGFVVITVAVP